MLLLKGLLRGIIPLFIMGGIAIILYFQGKYSDAKGTLVASLIAFFVGAATVIYNIDEWSLAKRSIVHFIAMLLTVYPVLLLSGWFQIRSVFDALNVLMFFVLAGIILWSVMATLAKVFSW